VAAGHAPADDAAVVVDRLQKALVDTAVHTDPSPPGSRFRELEPVVASSHDFPAIARLVGGRFWRKLNDVQRTRFTSAFRRASIATYASRFASPQGVKFDHAVVHQTLGNRVTVRSHLIRTDGSRVTFDYILQHVQDRWRIVTVLVDGVSDLALQRAELTRIFNEKGFAGVMDHLRAKAESG